MTRKNTGAKIHKLSLQTRDGKYLENQRSNNTQTLKILEKKFFERRTKSRNSGRENSEAQKCAAKTNFNSKKEKQAKRVLTWTELKLFERTDNNAFHS